MLKIGGQCVILFIGGVSMAKMNNRIKDKIINMKTNTNMSLQKMCDVIQDEDGIKISRSAINKFLNSENTIRTMVATTVPNQYDTPSFEYLDLRQSMQDIKSKCVSLIEKSLDNLLKHDHPEDNMFAISKILTDVIKLENQKENQYNKLKLEVEKFEFEKSKVIIDNSSMQNDIREAIEAFKGDVIIEGELQ